jgi:hypothetical protein
VKLAHMKSSRARGWIACALLLPAVVVQATSLLLTPIEDATITEKNLGTPVGGAATLETGTTGASAGFKNSRALLRFDLAGNLPANALITSAALTLQLTKTAPGVTNLWEDLRRVSQPWSESLVTWTNRLTPPSSWSVPGGGAPLDYASVVTQSNLITTTLGPYTFASNSAMIADVQNWLVNPATNFGWVMISELQGVPTTECQFASRESGAGAPTLAIQYSLPVAPPALTILPSSNGNFQFSFNAESSRTYSVEFTGELPASNWSVLTNLPALPAPGNVVVASSFTTSNRLHRVRTP